VCTGGRKIRRLVVTTTGCLCSVTRMMALASLPSRLTAESYQPTSFGGTDKKREMEVRGPTNPQTRRPKTGGGRGGGG
jgi:hypothetical protein